MVVVEKVRVVVCEVCGEPTTCSPTPETRSLTCAKCEVAGWRPRATLTQWRGFDDEMLG